MALQTPTMSHDFDQTAHAAFDTDNKPPKRQRLDSTVAPDQYAYPNPNPPLHTTAHAPRSHMDISGGYMMRSSAGTSTTTTQLFTDTQQLEIYYAWHQAGSPHNYVCYECRKPYDLMCCKTCCRAYHVDCLASKPSDSPPPDPLQDQEWHCDACKRRKWDTNPPLSHELPTHPGIHPSQTSRSHSWAATSNRHETPSRKLQSFSEGHYPRRSSNLRHASDASIEEAAGFFNDIPHSSYPFEHRPREPSRISEGDEPTADEIYATGQQMTLTLQGHPTHSAQILPQADDDAIAKMKTEIEALREELDRKDSQIKELEELREENILLKNKIESLQAAPVTVMESSSETVQ